MSAWDMPTPFDSFLKTRGTMQQQDIAATEQQFNLAKLSQIQQSQEIENKSRQLGMKIAQDNLNKQSNPAPNAVTLANLSEVPDAATESAGGRAVAQPAVTAPPKQSEVLTKQAADLRSQADQYGAIGNIKMQQSLIDEARKTDEKLYQTQAEERKADAEKKKAASAAFGAVNSQEALDAAVKTDNPEHFKAIAPLFNLGLDGKPIWDDKAKAATAFIARASMDAAKQAEFDHKAISDQLAATKAENQALYQKELIRTRDAETARKRDADAKKPDASVSALTPEAIQAEAESYNTGKALPTRLDSNTRQQIINKATELKLASGDSTANRPAQQAEFKANSAALTNVTKDLAAIRPYKEMLDTNIDIAKQLATKAISTDSRFANKSINWLKQNATDNPDVSEYLAQVHFVTTEAARVLSNPRLVGQLTDTAIKDMQGVISGDMPINSAIRVMDRMKSDGVNRVKAMEDQHSSLVKKMSGGKSAAPASQFVEGQLYSDASGNKARYVKGQWVPE